VRRLALELAFALATLVFASGCKGESPGPAAKAEPNEKSPEPAAGCAAAPNVWRFPVAERVVAIGDVHGDLSATRRALRGAGLIDDGDRWIGGEAVLVQTGDVLDRGDDELEIFELLAALALEANAARGRVIVLNGNHELMNAAGDFRYVTKGGYEDFADVGRAAAFAPGGPWAKRLAAYPLIAVVGDSVFVHGGLEASQAREIEVLNRSTQCWLLGDGPGPRSVLAADDSPVWTRRYGGESPACGELTAVLGALEAKRLVVGHTPQRRINSACDERLWRIDVGMAAAYGGKAAALEITKAGTRVIDSDL